MSAPLIYFSTSSLDGYRAGPGDRIDFTNPSDDVLEFINELFRPTRLHLYGRRNYEVMTYWDTVDADELEGASVGWLDVWNSTDKVIYSTTLTELEMRRAELRSSFDADEVRRWKAESDAPIAIGGGVLASEAARAGVLDEVHVIVAPVYLGGGTRFFDEGLHLELELLDERRFDNGSIYLRSAVRP
jgi:dihydrofolate reductase